MSGRERGRRETGTEGGQGKEREQGGRKREREYRWPFTLMPEQHMQREKRGVKEN